MYKITKEQIEENIRFCEYTLEELQTRTLPAIKRKIKFYRKMLKDITKKSKYQQLLTNQK